MISGLRREPLFWFVLAGAALFAASAWQGGADHYTIVADETALADYVRQQSRDFVEGRAEQRLSASSGETREDLLARFVRDEALYREALALGLDGNDYIIRRRLIQRIEFMAQGVATAQAEVDDAAARTWYAAHPERYRRDARITFTHVFFPAGTAVEVGNKALHELNRENAPRDKARSLGARFLYHRNYVDRTQDFVGSHFGAHFGEALFSLGAEPAVWQGPIESSHGKHLVLVTDYKAGVLPPFEDVREQALADARHAEIRRISASVIANIVARYTVVQPHEES